ncbi:MAG: biopolymer transporter ExbD [Sumerlaeia bacterium]
MALGRRRRPVSQPRADINITSLLDITFVLLIAFMIVAPALKHGVDIELPQVAEAPALEETRPLTLLIKPGSDDPLVFLDGTQIEFPRLAQTLQAQGPGRPISLEADRRVDWQQMARVITVLETSGIPNIGIVTQPKND